MSGVSAVDMATKFPDQMVFHMTGKRVGDAMTPVEPGMLRPASLAHYRDLTRLRYDFPLVLPESSAAPDYVHSLSSIVGSLLADLAPRGPDGERLRKHVLRLERELRTMLASGASGALSELWADAVRRLSDGADEVTAKVLAQAGDSLKLDGELVDCDAQTAERLIRQGWRHVQQEKSRQFHATVDALMRKLSDIRRAAFARSAAGQQPEALAASIGSAHAGVFDFSAMSRLVLRNTPEDELPAERRARIDWALAVLGAQTFFPESPGVVGDATANEFCFDNCAAALDAYRTRLPQMVEVVKAIAIAELEADGAYDEVDHGPYFERYDENLLNADDLALFPDYLVCIPADRNNAPENAGLIEMLSSGLPVKVLVLQTEIIEESSIGTGHFPFGVRSARLGTTAMGLGGMYVLQATSAELYALREPVRRGLSCRGPALFSVFAGPSEQLGGLPPYLIAAAAKESRAFPAFVYDAAAGANWAERFSLENNRDPDADWPVDLFDYADAAQQRVTEPVAFTYADFVFSDPRHLSHFAVVPRTRWNAAMVPVAQWLQLLEQTAAQRVPFLWAVDGDDRLHRVIVDLRLMQATRRCLLLWHRLQEHAGIHDSHAERLLKRERAAWDLERQQSAAQPQQSVPGGEAAADSVQAAPISADDASQTSPPPSDEAWIETARCPSCNECNKINDRMFAYNDNKQAYIKDIGAGTYRQLVEAAEVCQVAIIHPGKPRNPKEPGLEELLQRAAPFL